MLDEVYTVFGLSYTAELSTRPESRMGEEAQWDRAETALQEALEAQEAKTGHSWKVCPWFSFVDIASALAVVADLLCFLQGSLKSLQWACKQVSGQ